MTTGTTDAPGPAPDGAEPAVPGDRAPRHRVRSALAALLLLLTALLTPASIAGVWAADEIGDADRYVAAMAPLSHDPAVRAAVTDRVTSAVEERLDLSALLDDSGERSPFDELLGRLSGSLTGLVHDTVGDFVDGPDFAPVWNDLNRSAHTAVDNALTDGGDGSVEITDDAVKVDLAPVADRVKQRLVDDGIGPAARIPEIHTDLTVVRSEKVGEAREVFRLLRSLGGWLPAATLATAAAGVLLAVRRRRALALAALTAVAGATALGLALWVFRASYLDALPAGTTRSAAAAVYDALVRFLHDTVRTVVALGAVVAATAWLSGPGRGASRVRSAWSDGIGRVRSAVGVTGTGAVGRWVDRARPWPDLAVVAVAAATLLARDRPGGAAVLCVALGALLALAVIEFLDDDGAPHPAGTEDSHPVV